MNNIHFLRNQTLLLFLLLLSSFAVAQQPRPVGRLIDFSRNIAFTMFNDYVLSQQFPPGYMGPPNIIQTFMDPSGQVFRVLPSANPAVSGFFIDWNNNLVELSIFAPPRVIGVCECPPPINPYLQLPSAHYSPNLGVQTQNGFRQLPVELAKPYQDTPYGSVMITSEQQAQQCYQNSMTPNGLDRNKFTQCMVENMAGERELAIFNCIRDSKTPEERTLCLLSVLGGTKEKQIAQQLTSCYQTYGDDYSKYPLCLAGSSVDGDLGKVLACMEQQSRTGDASFTGTAVCYGASSLNLNPETQIILECAAASGGDPYVFAGCAGGQLVTRELDKCFVNGIGGSNGCFGKNNEIVKGLAAIGRSLNIEFGPNNDATKLWNKAVRDITEGPGKNHEAIKTFRNVGNEMNRAANNVNTEVAKAATNVGREIKKVIPRITF